MQTIKGVINDSIVTKGREKVIDDGINVGQEVDNAVSISENVVMENEILNGLDKGLQGQETSIYVRNEDENAFEDGIVLVKAFDADNDSVEMEGYFLKSNAGKDKRKIKEK